MKQKMVVKVSMNGDKSRSKALKIVVGVSGVESAALKGDDKCQIEVIGNGIDAVQLTTLLRKGVGYTELMTVGAADEKKPEEKKTEEAKMQAMPVWHMWEVSNPAIPVYSYQQEPPCNIL
ncbi:uncharacterized protein LOC110808720 [Carica papaya]|uniref:uncharacterized protein LOC110808720 n=1 Tax=Carica papaya TaxID=3649 RepID=UPI000B8CDE2A|nr:uncharacterized protein LOC110808720 [Carica papaya]